MGVVIYSKLLLNHLWSCVLTLISEMHDLQERERDRDRERESTHARVRQRQYSFFPFLFAWFL